MSSAQIEKILCTEKYNNQGVGSLLFSGAKRSSIVPYYKNKRERMCVCACVCVRNCLNIKINFKSNKKPFRKEIQLYKIAHGGPRRGGCKAPFPPSSFVFLENNGGMTG